MSENTIHAAINAVMKEVGYVQKVKSDQLRYSYAGEAALIQACRPSMVEHGIYMSVSKIHNITREQYSTKNGTAMTNTVIHGTVRFTHVSGEFIEVDSVGEGSDSGDKSANKAMTGMYKYALRQTLNIETGDDPDKFSSDEQERPDKVLSQKPAPEQKVIVPATDIQKLRVDFGKVFSMASNAGLKDLPTINGKSTEDDIKKAIGKIQLRIATAGVEEAN